MDDTARAVANLAAFSQLLARIEAIEIFLQSFCALQPVHQRLVAVTEEERSALETLVVNQLETWKNALRQSEEARR